MAASSTDEENLLSGSDNVELHSIGTSSTRKETDHLLHNLGSKPEEAERVTLQAPPSSRVSATQQGQLLEVHINPVGITPLFFFCLVWNTFMVFWTVISLANNAWFPIAFGTLHYLSGLGLAIFVLWQLSGREILTIGPKLWSHKQLLWGWVWKEESGPMHDLAGASVQLEVTNGDSGQTKEWKLFLKGKNNYQLGSGRPHADLDWLAGVINMHLQQSRELEAGASHVTGHSGSDSLARGAFSVDQEEEEQAMCVVCFSVPRKIWLAPCGHRPMCAACTHQLLAAGSETLCPICRSKVESTIAGIFP